MPRRNENAFHSGHERRTREWASGSEEPLARRGYRDPSHWNPLLSQSTIKTTGEGIVREYRNTIRHREESIPRQVHIQAPKKSIIRKIFDHINWGLALEYACWATLIGCLIYVGIFVIAPFGIKLWK